MLKICLSSFQFNPDRFLNQHLILHTSDGVIARLTPTYPHYDVLMVDYQRADKDVRIDSENEGYGYSSTAS